MIDYDINKMLYDCIVAWDSPSNRDWISWYMKEILFRGRMEDIVKEDSDEINEDDIVWAFPEADFDWRSDKTLVIGPYFYPCSHFVIDVEIKDFSFSDIKKLSVFKFCAELNREYFRNGYSVYKDKEKRRVWFEDNGIKVSYVKGIVNDKVWMKELRLLVTDPNHSWVCPFDLIDSGFFDIHALDERYKTDLTYKTAINNNLISLHELPRNISDNLCKENYNKTYYSKDSSFNW